jgi:hypothetical protein
MSINLRRRIICRSGKKTEKMKYGEKEKEIKMKQLNIQQR